MHDGVTRMTPDASRFSWSLAPNRETTMGIQTNIIRRGATYAWRKRLPVRLGGDVMQISLRTNDPLIARRLAAIVTAESMRVFDHMAATGLSKDDARKLLVAVIEEELNRIGLRRAAASDQGDRQGWEDDQSADWAMGKALMFMAARGAAANLNADDIMSLQAEGHSAEDIERVQANIDLESHAYRQAPGEAGNSRALQAMRRALGREQFAGMDFMQGRQIWYRGRAAALLISAKADQPFDEAMALADDLAHGRTASGTAKPAAPAIASPDPDYDPAIAALIARLMAQKQRQGISDQMITQMTRIFELFAEATGVTDIRDLRQAHVAKFVDVLHQLPATYRKSPKDRDKPLSQILAEASGKGASLSTTTISRNLDYLGQLLTKAKSEGFANVMQIDLGSLRPRKTRRDRDERPAFTADDIQRLFGHSVWQGNLPKQKWQEPGPTVSPDGLYWAPMIAALTGARREEIAGLKAADITCLDGMPVIRIAENANRGLKTLASARTLPLHPQLIELGLVEQAQDQIRKGGPDADLFPDLRPPQSGTKFGDQLDYRFRLLVQNRLNGNPEGKVFHSFRHYVTTQLGRIAGVPEQLRKDILGHVGADITSERYSERATLAAMAEAIGQLPRLPVTAKPTR